MGVAGAILAITVWTQGWLKTWEDQTWDWRASVSAEPGPNTDEIVVILLDQNSLDWARRENGLSWPWPREVYSVIIDYCRRAEAKALAFDVLFSEPSTYGVEDDKAFGRAIAAFGGFTGSVFLERTTGDDTAWPDALPVTVLNIEKFANWLAQADTAEMTFPRASLPILDLAKNAAVLANVNMTPDADGIYREIKLFGIFDNRPLPSLGMGIYLAAHPETPVKIIPGEMAVGKRKIPIDRKGNAVLRYRGPSGTYRSFSAAAIIQSELRIRNRQTPTIRDANTLKDKYVLFGFSAPGLFDLRSSPVDGVYPGVEIHATVLDNLLSGDFIKRAPIWMTLGAVMAIALACGVLASLFRRPFGNAAVSFGFLAAPVFICTVFYVKGIWLPMVVQELAVLLTITLGLGVNYTIEGRQKRFIKNAFKQYLSPAVIDQIIRHPERLKLGGERRMLSIFFSDIQGFTSISEGLDPEDLTLLLNDYLTAMTEIIHQEGGTVDKYEGDAIIAFWNAPLEVPDHAVRVVTAALRCQKQLSEMAPDFKNRIGRDMFTRIGINTGLAVVGNMGSHSRFDYTMLGDAVNLAARLEGSNKQFGTATMISESTCAMMNDRFPVRELARLTVVGRTAPVTVYEPMLEDQYETKKAMLETFNKGLRLFYKGEFDAAAEAFSVIRKQDTAAAAYAEKCLEMQAHPPENWEGVWVMGFK